MEGYIGEVRLFGGAYAPQHWAFCQGQLLPVTQYQSLYAVIGTTFGGDGVNNFALPNLSGRAAIGTGQGTGLTNRREGDMLGSESITLTASQMPSHTHAAVPNLTAIVRCNDQISDNESPVGNTLAVFKEDKNAYNTQAPDADMHDNTLTVSGTIQVSNTGGNQPHQNIQPSLALNYIICLTGIYPPRD